MDHTAGTLDEHPLLAGLRAAGAGLTQAAGPGAARVWQLSAPDTAAAVCDLLALHAQTTATLAALLTHAETIAVKDELAAPSTARWLEHKARITRAEANAHLRTADALTRHPEAAALLATGRAGPTHAQTIAATLDRLDALGTVDPPTRARAAAFLHTQATQLTPTDLQHAATALVETLTTTASTDDPADEPTDPPPDRAPGRYWVHRRDRDGTWSGHYKGLDDLAGAAFDTWLHHATRPPTDHDADPRHDHPTDHPSAASPAGSPEDDPLTRDTRTHAQRRVDAFAELVHHALANADLPGHDGRRPPVLLVACDYDTTTAALRHGRLDTGEPIADHDLRRLACTARILPAVMNGTSHVLDLGRAQRLFTTAQRHALALRDRGCTFPGCPRPARACQAHHRCHWEDHGPTDLANGTLLCDYHHDRVHREGWTSRLSPANGHIEWQPPATLDPAQRWRQHHRYQLRDLVQRE
jgi:hypothetical protein